MLSSKQEVFVDLVVSFQVTIEPDSEVTEEELKAYFANEDNRIAVKVRAPQLIRFPTDRQVGWFNENVIAEIVEISGEEVLKCEVVA